MPDAIDPGTFASLMARMNRAEEWIRSLADGDLECFEGHCCGCARHFAREFLEGRTEWAAIVDESEYEAAMRDPKVIAFQKAAEAYYKANPDVPDEEV